MDPGTALAIVGLGLDAVKDLHSYYVVWKDRDRDVEEVGQQLIWLMNLFQTMQITLKQDDLNPAQVQMICGSIKKCEEIITKLKVKLAKVKREGDPRTLLKKLDDQRRRALYPFKKGTIGGLLDLIDSCKEEMKMVIPLLNL
ncbi:uncharacterized protein K444DRAFT_187412 [Hyaloscypha bicolor E]|uniref:Fungal N-terminal domain-containing protein n=1 Tax=Hyaloscypha bicolor E TaxID=1095630 RepID=A0A2J6SPH7_9HELO|nr:uncharacterized protein K444DRAFT_187412 [Hyaloscypha bicolor E]PMD52657.1 hypothetical protein K444DRAFT_187412 [Hyaloscypha bicolor E]